MNNHQISALAGALREPKRALKYFVLPACVIAATVALEELFRFLEMGNVQIVLLFMLSTFIIARITTGYVVSITAAVLNTFLYDYFVTDPRLGFSFTMGLPITLIIMLVVSIITSAATTQIKAQMVAAQMQERRTELMLEISQEMSASNSVDSIVRIAAHYLSQLMMTGVFYRSAPENRVFTAFYPEGGQGIQPSDGEIQEAQHLYRHPGLCAGHNSGHFPIYYFPAMANNTPMGMIAVYTLGKNPDKNQSAMAQIISGQTALAMELHDISEERTKTLMLAEKEKTRSNLLRAISHDLRTPLTGILSASSILAEKTKNPMAMGIREDTEWLIHMVENLLMITRITEGENKIAKKPEIAEEAMARATNIVRKRFPQCQINVKAPSELVMVPMDAMLISQTFINLLENSVKHSPDNGPVYFDLDVIGHSARFTVSDRGEGIPENLLDHIFGQYVTDGKKPVDSVSGIGLGLAICKTIIEAHGGTITGENREKGGAQFSVYLPMDG